MHENLLSSSPFSELSIALMLCGLEECRERHLTLGPEVGAVGPGVGGVPRGAAHLTHQLPQVGAGHATLFPMQAVARVDRRRLSVLFAESTARMSPEPGSHSPRGFLSLQCLNVESPEQ